VSAATRRYLLAAVSCGVSISACAIAASIVLAHLVAGVITEPATRTVGHWAAALLILLALYLIRAASTWVQARLSQRGAAATITGIAEDVLTSVTADDPRRVDELHDDAAVVLLRALDGLRPYFTAYLPALFQAALLTPAAVVAIAVFDVQSAIVVLVALPLIPIFMVLIGLATADRSAAALQAMSTLQSRLLDLIAGIPTLRALGRAEGPRQRIAELGATQRRSAMATLRIAFLSTLVLELIATLGVALVAVGVGLRLVFGEIALVNALTALLLAPDVFWPLRRVGVEFHAAQEGKAAADKAFAILDRNPAQPATPGAATVEARGETIRITGLSVAGRDGPAPRALTVDLEPGRLTVLTGPNGAGKSTTFQVITGLTRPTAGSVTIAGIDVTDLDPQRWWSQLAWLPQRPALIPGTVADNLALFGELHDLENACADSGFDTVIAELPDGVRTLIGHRGVGLSLGQRQRLGLARTLGSAAPVLLLDEPTAHLDAATESRVLRALAARARRGDTVVVIAHHPAALAAADRIAEVGDGAHV